MGNGNQEVFRLVTTYIRWLVLVRYLFELRIWIMYFQLEETCQRTIFIL